MASNQRAFAARFASPPAPPPSELEQAAADAAAAEASLLMPPPHLPTPAQQASGSTRGHSTRAKAAAEEAAQAVELLLPPPPDPAAVALATTRANMTTTPELEQQPEFGAPLPPSSFFDGHAIPSSKRRPSATKKASSSSAGYGSKHGGGGRWTKEEDSKLRAAVQIAGLDNWLVVAEQFLGGQRTDVQCLHRWQKVLQPGLVKGPWTKEEDQIIIDCIEAAITKWADISDRIPGRIGKQCRERWFNHLDPSLKKGGWTDEEDAVLVEAQAKWGNAWTKIAKIIPGRSENAVKNRWNSATRRRQKGTTKAADKVAQDALALVEAADLAEKAAERERGSSAASSRGHAEDEDTECVPRSAIALLRAKREEARRAMELGEPPPDNAVGWGLRADGPVLHPKAANPAMDVGSGSGGGGTAASASKSGRPQKGTPSDEDDEDDEDFAEDEMLEMGDEGGEKGMGAEMYGSEGEDVAEDDLGNLHAPDPADLHHDGAPGNGEHDPLMNHLFADASLTAREKELIYRAYLAGIAQSGGSNGPSPPNSGDRGAPGSNRNSSGSGGNMARSNANPSSSPGNSGSGRKQRGGGRSPVQWDFHSEGPGGGGLDDVDAGASEVGGGGEECFLREFGIDFQDDVHRHEGLADDLELSSSLLTMSLDQDMPGIDDMALSAGERERLLGRPLAEDALAALAASGGRTPTGGGGGRTVGGSHGHTVQGATAQGGSSAAASTTPVRSSQRRMSAVDSSSSSSENRRNKSTSHSPSGPLMHPTAAVQPQFRIDSGGPPASRAQGAGAAMNVDSSPPFCSNSSPQSTAAAAALHMQQSDRRGTKASAHLRSVHPAAAPDMEVSADMFDLNGNGDLLGSSADLVDLVNSPNLLWSVGSSQSMSSLSPVHAASSSSSTFNGDDELMSPVVPEAK